MPILNGIDLTIGRDILANGSKFSFPNKGVGYRPKIIWNGQDCLPIRNAGCVLYFPGYPGQGATIYDY